MNLSTKIFADTADLAGMRALADHPRVAGFTTNPTLMRKAGVTDYRAFAKEALAIAGGRPISFEIVGDDAVEISRQAREIAGWGDAAYVKIPITTTRGYSNCALVRDLSSEGVKVNVTAVFTYDQVRGVIDALHYYPVPHGAQRTPAVISVFAGRIYDAGMDAAVFMQGYRSILDRCGSHAQLLWASPRQVYDVVLAERAGADIITMPPELIAKLPMLGKDLAEFSRETVQMFFNDAQAAGYRL